MQFTSVETAILVVNGFAFLTYMTDKLLAKLGWRRVPESFLIMLGVLFGAAGSYLSMLLFRHKTRKPKFSVLIPVLLVLQLGVCVWQQIFFTNL